MRAVRNGERTLGRGDKGAAIHLLQEALLAQGFVVPEFDAEMASAVHSFQAAQGIVTDGIVGPKTLRALDAEEALRVMTAEADKDPVFAVVDADARIRSGPPGFKWVERSRIPLLTRVKIRSVEGKYVRVVGLAGKDYRWTARSNLGSYFKDSELLAKVPLAPEILLRIDASWPKLRRSLARTYARLGRLMSVLAKRAKIDRAAVLAVWQIESGGRRHTPGRAVIRFENHHFYQAWGKKKERLYNRHFRHGGHNGVSGSPWTQHKYRKWRSGGFRKFHGRQDLEYGVLELAIGLAGESTALKCISIGGPQILISNRRRIGYRTPKDMYTAFQRDERSHVLGFFDFCQHDGENGNLLGRLRAKDWTGFASAYNGTGQAERYGKLIGDAFEEGVRLFA